MHALLKAGLAALLLALLAGASTPSALAGTTVPNAPQVLFALTNSESMDGQLNGAILVGSGSSAIDSQLYNSSSPTTWTQPNYVGLANSGSNAYTVPCPTSTNSAQLCDNGPSRLNLAKTAIDTVIGTYAGKLNFGLYTFQTNTLTQYGTWVYYMSPSGCSFLFSNSASNGVTTGCVLTSAASTQLQVVTLANPCYGYKGTTSTYNATVDCNVLDAHYKAISVISSSDSISKYAYLVANDTSDDPLINDVLYAFAQNSPTPSIYLYCHFPSVFLSYGNEAGQGGVSPVTGEAAYSMADYNANNVVVTYPTFTPIYNCGGAWGTYPTNAGYLPSATGSSVMPNEVLYALRGFGFGANVSSTTGTTVVAMNALATGDPSLSAETSDPTTAEVKSSAGQSPVGGLMKGALSYLNSVKPTSGCTAQYVVLLTDGLPTLDNAGNPWPPLGSTAAALLKDGSGNPMTASFNPDGSLGSSNDGALNDAIAAIKALNTAGIQTYVIGIGAGISANPTASAVLTAMAMAGGTTNPLTATDPTSLNNAVNSVVNAIYTAASVASPIAPLTVTSGSSLEYLLTSSSPAQAIAGHVSAYPVSSGGVASTTASWDAGNLMTTTNRTTGLYSTGISNSATLLTSMDTAAFNLTPTTCVPNTTTIVNYTINPSYTSTISACGTGSVYIGTRQPGWLLGEFSTQDSGAYVGPPASSALVGYPGYTSYAVANAQRTPMLMFTNNDGFLYSVNASTGALLWGWTPRSLLAQMQNYLSFPGYGWFNGNFTVVDAQDSAGVWSSYVVGSAQSGAEHFAIQLTNSTSSSAWIALPSKVIYDTTVTVTGGSVNSPGDVTVPTGSGPLTQPTQVVYVLDTSVTPNRTQAYAVYVVNTTLGATTTSMLYEVNVASGVTTSAPLSTVVSSQIFVDPNNNTLWFGSAAGGVWTMPLSGVASTDVGTLNQIGSTVSPTSGAAVTPVTYVSYTEIAGVPYVLAANPAQVTAFTVGVGGWAPVWAATTTSGYLYSSGSFAISATVPALTSGAVISDLPTIVNGAIILPEFVPPSNGCGSGTGYYGFYGFKTGAFPNIPLTLGGSPITTAIAIGPGPAFTPSATVTINGVALNPGSAGSLVPLTPLQATGNLTHTPVGWRQL